MRILIKLITMLMLIDRLGKQESRSAILTKKPMKRVTKSLINKTLNLFYKTINQLSMLLQSLSQVSKLRVPLLTQPIIRKSQSPKLSLNPRPQPQPNQRQGNKISNAQLKSQGQRPRDRLVNNKTELSKAGLPLMLMVMPILMLIHMATVLNPEGNQKAEQGLPSYENDNEWKRNAEK